MTESKEFKKFLRDLKRLDAAALKAVIERRHPQYASKLGHWNFLEQTFKGGRDWFDSNIFKYVKEGDTEYRDRVARAYRFPHTRETISLTNKYIFKGKIVRKEDDASQEVKDFWNAATLQRRKIDDFMPLVSERSSVFGRVWVVVDSNASDEDATVIDQKENGSRVYAYTRRPQDVLDLARGADGQLEWIMLAEIYRDDGSFLSSGGISTRYRLWTRDYWALFEEAQEDNNRGRETVYKLLEAGEHGLGIVPVICVDHQQSEDPYTATGLIEDIAYLDKAVANYLSNLDAIIQDQTFSQLVLPAQAMLPGEDGSDKLMETGTKRIFTYDGQGGIAPQYISPDPKQASVILDVISKIVNEIYHSIGIAGERTKQDNSQGIDNSSGVAKAYDFERLNSMLAAKARSLEIAENSLCELVDAWHGVDVEQGSYNYVRYPESFDVRGLADELQIGMQLNLLQAPDGVRREQMTTIIDKLFPHVGEQGIAKLKEELKEWPPELEVLSPSSPPSAFKENRQGENNKEKDGKTKDRVTGSSK